MSRCFIGWTLQFTRCKRLNTTNLILLKRSIKHTTEGCNIRTFHISPQMFSPMKIKQNDKRIRSAKERNMNGGHDVVEDGDNGDRNGDELPVKRSQFLLDQVSKLNPLSPKEWESFKEAVFASDKHLHDRSFDARVMSICCYTKQLAVALSFIRYLSHCGRKPNQATIGHFMQLCYICRNEVNSEIKQMLLMWYEDIRSENPVFDAYSAEHFIIGLSITHMWKEGLNLLEMIKAVCTPNCLAYNALIKAGFDNNEPDVSEKILEDLLGTTHRIMPEVCHAWLDYCDRTAGGNKFLRWQKVVDFLHKIAAAHHKPTRDVAEKLNKWYMELESPVSEVFTSVSTSGVCQACRKKLEPLSVSEKDFNKLRIAFLQKVVAGGKDEFVKSTPLEIQKFMEFVKKTAPYTLVIDGLNTAYTFGIKEHNHPKIIYDVVKHFIYKSEKVLLVGRKHMENWSKQYMDYIKKNTHVFLAQDLSQDDPFLLYAALYSGLGTKFLSRDLMRGHAFLLQDPALRSIFKRWQMKHQYQIKGINQSGKLILKYPLTFNPATQVSKEGNWHIPYEMEFEYNPPQMFEPPVTWLCLRAPKISKSCEI